MKYATGDEPLASTVATISHEDMLVIAAAMAALANKAQRRGQRTRAAEIDAAWERLVSQAPDQ